MALRPICSSKEDIPGNYKRNLYPKSFFSAYVGHRTNRNNTASHHRRSKESAKVRCFLTATQSTAESSECEERDQDVRRSTKSWSSDSEKEGNVEVDLDNAEQGGQDMSGWDGENKKLETKRSLSGHLIDLCDAYPTRRNSQHMFRDRNQTLIVFDWDDTLFPTHWTRLHHRSHWRGGPNQPKTYESLHPETRNEYARFAEKVKSLLERALELAHVVIVTLSRDPWVEISCHNFLRSIGELICKHKIEIIYAQKPGVRPEKSSSCSSQREYWTAVKQKAITNEANSFYSRYEGQSWKNLISIGDSVFERDATLITTQKYSLATGLKVHEPLLPCCFDGVDTNNHYRKIRAKTIKMIEDPLISDLSIEIELLHKWLPSIIQHDGGFNLDLKSDRLQEELDALFRIDNANRPRHSRETTISSRGSGPHQEYGPLLRRWDHQRGLYEVHNSEDGADPVALGRQDSMAISVLSV